MEEKWYVIRTQPSAEYLAAEELEQDGLDVFFPCIPVALPRPGHTDTPLFPGYLFLRCNQDQDGWPSFRPGGRVYGWVQFGADVPSLDDDFVSDLKQSLSEIRCAGGMWRRYQPGEQVRVMSGKVEALAEVLEESTSPSARVRVLLEFMGGKVQAQVPWGDIRPTEDSNHEMVTAKRRTRGRGRWIQGFGPRATVTAYRP